MTEALIISMNMISLPGYAETSRDTHFYYLKETTLDHAEAKNTKMSMDNFSALKKNK